MTTTIDLLARRNLLRACGGMAAGLLSAPVAWAQLSASLRLVVGFPAGGTADALARVLAPAMASSELAVLVENKAPAPQANWRRTTYEPQPTAALCS